MISGSDDRTIKVWEVASGNLINTLTGHEKEVENLEITPDGQQLISTGYESEINIWNLRSGQLIRKIDESTKVYSIMLLPNGKQLAVGLKDGQIDIFDIANGKKLRKLKGHTDDIRSLQVSEMVKGSFQERMTVLSKSGTWQTAV